MKAEYLSATAIFSDKIRSAASPQQAKRTKEHRMLKKMLTALGIGAAPAPTAKPSYTPYPDASINFVYNLLFCDDLKLFAPRDGQVAMPWYTTLQSDNPDIEALNAIANDPSAEGRVRYLAFAKLRELEKPVPSKILLGVILEVPMAGGLDTLAAYSDGGVRYINHTGSMVVVEGANDFSPLVDELFATSNSAIQSIGPWEKPRRAPPNAANLRLTFLVSDGMYLGEGPRNAMSMDATAGPIIERAGILLQALVQASIKRSAS